MANAYLDCNERLLSGDDVYLSILVWDEANPDNDLSAATATMQVFDKNGGVVLASGAATVTGTTLLEVKRLFDTTGFAGAFRAVFAVTVSGIRKSFQFEFQVDPLPGPQ